MEKRIKEFYDLDAWKQAHVLILEVYAITQQFPKDELFGIVSQLRRAACSIAANIAEGFERYHFNDKIRFYHQARGSVAEVQNFLILASDLHFIASKQKEALMIQADKTRQLINGMIRSIEHQQ